MTDQSDRLLALIVIAIATIVIVALLAGAFTPPSPTDRAFLATEISRLHDDVRLLQTQVGPKQ